MLNVFRAQVYRLVRNVTFWGFLALYAAIMIMMMASVGVGYHGQPGYQGLPSTPPGTNLAFGPEVYLGKTGVVFFAPTLLCLLVPTFFVEDFRERTIRSLDVEPHFRRDYVVSGVLVVGLMALCFLVVALLAVYAVFVPFFPRLAVCGSGGRLFRWALQLWLIMTFYGTLALAVTVAAGRQGLALLFALLLGCGAVEIWLVDAIAAAGDVLCGSSEAGLSSAASLVFLEEPRGFAGYLPAGQLWGMLQFGSTPTAAEIAPTVLAVFCASGICWLAMRRKRL